MSRIDDLEEHLQRYWQMDHHRKPAVAASLEAVQHWQKQRMERTHAQLFSAPEHQALAQYFLNRLYGGADFSDLARELERILFRARKLESIVPDNALKSASLGISLSLFAIELDEAVAKYLLEHELDTKDEHMEQAYRALDQEQDRREQMSMLNTLCLMVEKYLRAGLLQAAFNLARGTAYKHNFKLLYDFIDEGFKAMKPIKSMPAFIDKFCERELTIITQLHNNQPNPFVIEDTSSPAAS